MSKLATPLVVVVASSILNVIRSSVTVVCSGPLPINSSTSFNRSTVSSVLSSPRILNDVAIFAVVTLVNCPLAFTVITGIAVAEP